MTLVLLLGVFGGIWLDGKWGTDPILTIVGSFAGIGLGLAIVIRETGSGTRGS
jgi:F0F1-type ATP synthase assembly protein I